MYWGRSLTLHALLPAVFCPPLLRPVSPASPAPLSSAELLVLQLAGKPKLSLRACADLDLWAWNLRLTETGNEQRHFSVCINTTRIVLRIMLFPHVIQNSEVSATSLTCLSNSACSAKRLSLSLRMWDICAKILFARRYCQLFWMVRADLNSFSRRSMIRFDSKGAISRSIMT